MLSVVRTKADFVAECETIVNDIRMDMRTKPNRGERARFDRAIRHIEAASAMTNARFQQRYARRRVQQPPTGRYFVQWVGR